MNILDQFKKDPEAFCNSKSLFVENFDCATTTEDFKMGGSVNLKIEDVGNGVYKARVTGYEDSNKKYYFVPYARTGCCIVPASASVGTLVFTPLMNGCSLYVKKMPEEYAFYHDVNDDFFRMAPASDFCCKITSKDYEMPLQRGYHLSIEKTTGDTKYMFGHSLISLKMEDKWRVFVMGVLLGKSSRDKGKKSIYEPFRPLVCNCITSFL